MPFDPQNIIKFVAVEEALNMSAARALRRIVPFLIFFLAHSVERDLFNNPIIIELLKEFT